MPEKKRQHYVPQVVLRNYALDAERRFISVFNLKKKELKDAIPLNTQCYGDYFYGYTADLENIFDQMETKFSNILKDGDINALNTKSSADLDEIRWFVTFQHKRTAGAARDLNAFRKFLEPLLSMTEPDYREWPKGVPDSRAQMESVKSAALFTPIMSDMKVKFLINDTSERFIISDDPVVLHNQFAEYHRRFKHAKNLGGIAVMGLQLFFPVTPTMCIALYDSGRYEYGSSASQICRLGKFDVVRLNMLQMLHANTCVFTVPGTIGAAELIKLAQVRDRYEQRKPVNIARPVNGGRQLALEHGAPYVRTAIKFSFVKVIDSDMYLHEDPEMVPIRSWERVMEADALRTRLDKEFEDEMKSASAPGP